MRLNPNYGFLTLFGLGLAHFLLGNLAEATKAFDRSTVHNPDFDGSRIFLAASYGLAGEVDKAHETIAKMGESGAKILQQTVAISLPFKRGRRLEQSSRRVDESRARQVLA
jgi:predicted Zn-dependent protease